MNTSTRTHLLKGLRLFLVIIFIVLTVYTVRWFIIGGSTELINDPAVLDHGLAPTATSQAAASTEGHIYVFGTPAVAVGDPGEPAEPALLAFDLVEERFQNVPATPPAKAMEGDDPVYGVIIASFSNVQNEANAFHPAYIDYRAETVAAYNTPALWYEDVAVVPDRSVTDREFLAYAGMADKVTPGTEDWYDLANWQIVVHNPYTDETRIIEEAAEPVWLNDGADLLYLKTDGIYRYNVAADRSERIIDNWQGLTRHARMATAPDSSALLVTVPQSSSLAVYKFTDSVNGELRLQGIIADEDVLYTEPVFHPNGREYAVLALSNPQADNTFADMAIEHRHLFDRTLRNRWELDLDPTAVTYLLGWRTALEPFEWQ